jgi:hypothetical protein
MAKKTEHIRKSNGQWSIPGGPALPGQLSVDYEKGSILLEIYSANDIEGNDADILFNTPAGASVLACAPLASRRALFNPQLPY